MMKEETLEWTDSEKEESCCIANSYDDDNVEEQQRQLQRHERSASCRRDIAKCCLFGAINIAGESLLNDGSSIVFFAIFSEMFYSELNVPGLGQEYTFRSGLAKFCRMSFGAVAVGIFFGCGLLILLYMLDHRLHREENVVLVAATITMAYLCYFTADVVWGTSGVIATVVCGVIMKGFGESSVNDPRLLEDFWVLVEHLLNTVLFALGGLVWGSVIANPKHRAPGEFTGEDWGYLILLYVLLTAIRYLLFAIVYPIYSRIGLKSNIPEMIFQSYGGLRGAVGISLAIVLDNTVRSVEQELDSIYVVQTTKLFGFVGGIAFMTLCINATTAGPLLKKLGLAEVSSIRGHIIKHYTRALRSHCVGAMVRLLTQPRFAKVDFNMIRDCVPWIRDLTKGELLRAMRAFHQSIGHSTLHRREFDLSVITPLLKYEADLESVLELHARETSRPVSEYSEEDLSSNSIKSLSLIELRTVFLEMLKHEYASQIEMGELYNRQFLAFSLAQSLEFAADDVSKGEMLCDWKYVCVNENPWITLVTGKFQVIKSYMRRNVLSDFENETMRLDVERVLSFLHAHGNAQEQFRQKFMHGEFCDEEKVIISESEAECEAAKQVLNKYDDSDMEVIVTRNFCNILLSVASKYIEQLHDKGLLKETEAQKFLDEIQEAINLVASCRKVQ